MANLGGSAMFAASALDAATWAGLVAAVAAVAGLVAMGWLWRSTAPRRVTAGPATMDLRDETPALVDLLTGGFQVEDDAVPATVVDLAARKHIAIEELGGKVTLRLRRHGSQSDEELTPYEQRVMSHLERQAVDAVVPAEVVTIGPEGVSERWFRSFVREVNRHGQELGLCRRRFDLKHLVIAWAIVVAAFAPAWIVANIAPRTDDPGGWGSIGNLLVGLAFVIGFALVWVAQRISRSNAQHDTDAGLAAAQHWLGVRNHYRTVGDFDDKPAASVVIWGRHLACATAMGLAPVVQRQLPFETEHDRHAWSRATGQWRRIKIRYQAFVPGWGQHPGRMAFEGLVQAAFAAAIVYGGLWLASADLDLASLTDDRRRWIGLGGLVVAALAAAVCLFALAKLVLGLSDLFARQTVEGEVVRARRYRQGHRLPKALQWLMWSGTDSSGMSRDRQRETRYHLAIDPGDRDAVVASVVRESLYRTAPQGSRIRAVVTPRLGYVRSIEMLEPPRPSAAGDPVVHHQLATEVGSKVGEKLSSSMATAMGHLERAVDEDGRPVLDRTDAEGRSLHDKLAMASDQLERVRNDPRLKNSPLGGVLDAFLSKSTKPAEPTKSTKPAEPTRPDSEEELDR